ncbi:DNA repair protein RadA [Patescibacteria group bacterium]|nr:DNA repair protein RadA [Patescibacteria group bacterium]
MSKVRIIYICSKCGARSAKWQGKCFECGEFGTLDEKEEVTALSKNPRLGRMVGKDKAVSLAQIELDEVNRISTGFVEFDRVLGGGVVKSSTVLLAGGPGLGKSTLLLQAAAKISSILPVLYIAAEEVSGQIKLRSRRLAIEEDNVLVFCEIDVGVISSLIQDIAPQIGLVVIDSIQALSSANSNSYPGSVAQVREAASVLSLLCKRYSLPLILVGHIIKSGAIAGPKTLEHLVDVVLYLEGEQLSDIRLLRGMKNRFGSVLEVGVFKMGEKGLEEILDPSVRFMAERKLMVPGAVASVVLEGARPLVLEVQSLVSPSGFEKPLRNVVGIKYNRLLMLLAVLRRRVGLNFSRYNVFVNISGGVKVFEPGVDLAVCLALASSLKDKVVDAKIAAFGEVGLLGEVKNVTRQTQRIEVASRVGFSKIICAREASNLGKALCLAGI